MRNSESRSGAGGMECPGARLLRFLISNGAGGVLHSGYVSEHLSDTLACSLLLRLEHPPTTTSSPPDHAGAAHLSSSAPFKFQASLSHNVQEV